MHPPVPTASARAAARTFALASTNWNWRTLARSERERAQLAAPALGPQIARDAASTRADTTLARDRTALFVPYLDVREFHGENACLDRVEAAVVALDLVQVLA